MARVEGLHIQRATKVIEQLLDATIAGKANWERAERKDTYVYKGESGSVQVVGPMDPLFPSIVEQYTVKFFDHRNAQIFSATLNAVDATHNLDNSYLYQRLRRLWTAVATSGDPAIQVMDSIINELRD